MKVISCAAICIALLCTAKLSYAHPPSSITLGFNAQTGVLSVEAAHSVKNEAEHYIKDIKVFLNGKEIVAQKYAVQMNKEKQPASYIVPGVKKGDDISVEASCSRIGSKKAGIKIQ